MIKSIVKEQVLRPNKIKFLFWFLIFLVFFSFSMYMIFFYPRIDGKVMGGGISLLISAGLFFLLYKTAPWRATLTLTREGIFINNQPLPESNQIGRLVRWKEIKYISKFRQQVLLPRFPYTGKTDYIIIYLNPPAKDFSEGAETYKEKESFFIEKRYKEMRQGRHIYIPSSFLPHYSIDKNLNIFKDYPVKIENL